MKKHVFQNFAKFTGKHLWFAGLTPILKNICQQMLLHCTCTTHCFLCFTLYSAPSSPSSLLLLIISPMFVFGSNLKGFKFI